jgi:aspartate/methionine/tyrosine aminotransferase
MEALMDAQAGELKKGILAQTAEAKGKKINATIGEAVENDKSPMRLKSIEKQIFIAPESAFPYAPSSGKPELRGKWKAMIMEKNPPLNGNKYSLPIVTGGLTHGLSILGYLFINENDKIIIPDFYWENYNLIFTNWHGAVPDTFQLFKNNGLNTEALRAKLSEGGTGKKVLLLTFPNNPAGYTPTEIEMREIVAIIKESAGKGNKISVFIDDSYFGLVY